MNIDAPEFRAALAEAVAISKDSSKWVELNITEYDEIVLSWGRKNQTKIQSIRYYNDNGMTLRVIHTYP